MAMSSYEPKDSIASQWRGGTDENFNCKIEYSRISQRNVCGGKKGYSYDRGANSEVQTMPAKLRRGHLRSRSGVGNYRKGMNSFELETDRKDRHVLKPIEHLGQLQIHHKEQAMFRYESMG